MKMTKEELKTEIESCLSDVTFIYHNKNVGVTATVDDFKPKYQAWFGELWKEYSNADDLMSDTFYDNRSLNEIVQELDFQLY